MDTPLVNTVLAIINALSSTSVRVGAYGFLRWIPGHVFPNLIFTSFAVYLASFIALYFKKPKFEVIARESDVKLFEPPLPTPPAVEVDLSDDDGNVDTKIIVSEKPIIVEATETVVKRKIRPDKLKSLLKGSPEPNAKGITLVNLLLNSLLVAMTWDLTYRSEKFYPSTDLSFAKTGWVSEHTAKILIREPDTSKLPIHVSYRIDPEYEDIQYPWIDTESITKLGPATDYALPIELHNLHPATRYSWKTSNNHTGTFHTAPAKLSSLDLAMGATARKTKFSFLTSSCIKARFPYNPTHHPLHVRGFKTLGKLLKNKVVTPDFMMFLGDFIYVDVPKRPSKDLPLVEGYRQHYRQVYSSPDWPSVSHDLPWLHVVDDHEIANDWDKNTTGVYPFAMDPFYIYQHAANPPAVRPGATHYIFNHGTASFFMMDSRRYRSDNFATDSGDKTILGVQQKRDMIAWLRRDEPGIQWKILVSSVPFTKNWRFNDQDTWAGFLTERRQILEEMWKVGAEGRGGVVILSGDRHEFGATAFPPPADSPSHEHRQVATVHEFSCSPLSQFYIPKRTYVQTDDEDVLIKYVPDGNSKFGAVEVDSTNVAGEQAVLKYRLFVDGKEVWDWVVTADLSRRRIRGEVEGEGEKTGGRGLWE